MAKSQQPKMKLNVREHRVFAGGKKYLTAVSVSVRKTGKMIAAGVLVGKAGPGARRKDEPVVGHIESVLNPRNEARRSVATALGLDYHKVTAFSRWTENGTRGPAEIANALQTRYASGGVGGTV